MQYSPRGFRNFAGVLQEILFFAEMNELITIPDEIGRMEKVETLGLSPLEYCGLQKGNDIE